MARRKTPWYCLALWLFLVRKWPHTYCLYTESLQLQWFISSRVCLWPGFEGSEVIFVDIFRGGGGGVNVGGTESGGVHRLERWPWTACRAGEEEKNRGQLISVFISSSLHVTEAAPSLPPSPVPPSCTPAQTHKYIVHNMHTHRMQVHVRFEKHLRRMHTGIETRAHTMTCSHPHTHTHPPVVCT